MRKNGKEVHFSRLDLYNVTHYNPKLELEAGEFKE